MIRCIIFDLDQTVVDTSPIEGLRDKGNWKVVYSQLKKCSAYEGASTLFKMLRNSDIKIAIATNSPSKYANKLLSEFNLKADFLVGYHDVAHHKPAPDCVNKILSHFDLSPNEVLYVGNSDLDQKCAESSKVQFLAVQWGSVTSPDVTKIDFQTILAHIFQKNEPTLSPASLKLLQNGNHYYLGYYEDPIKPAIWDFKDNDDKTLRRWRDVTIEKAGDLPHVDIIVRSRGHAEVENTESPIDVIGNALSKRLGAQYVPDLLKKTRSTPKSTTLNRHQRHQQIQNTYIVNREALIGKVLTPSFLIIDDVYTTGATTSEITRALNTEFKSGKVHIFTLVKTGYSYPLDRVLSHNNLLLGELQADRRDIKKFREDRAPWRLVQKSYSANYSHTNHNFVFQNIPGYSIGAEIEDRKYLSGIYILKNILQRGKPTLLSRYLRGELGEIHKRADFKKGIALLGNERTKWARQIKGHPEKEFNPAQVFFDKILPKNLGEYIFVRELILPEVTIYDITQTYIQEFHDNHVDFYLPQAGLIIEIDGKQHKDNPNFDRLRDAHTKKYGIETVRFNIAEISSENEIFKEKIGTILHTIEAAALLGEERKKLDPALLTLNDYKKSFQNGIDSKHPIIQATAIMRLQLLFLDLIEAGVLHFNKKWDIEIRDHESVSVANLAINDLNIWLKNIFALQNINFQNFDFNISYLRENERFSNKPSIVKIDFSLTQRFTDEFQTSPDVIYVRTHYIDEYRYFKASTSAKMTTVEFRDYDLFRISTFEPLAYSLIFSNKSTHRQNLLFFLSNIFLPFLDDVDFRDGQLAIITSALSRKDTIGLLPTGSGKSICYQLAAILQPSISFVVCPIKSLMYDQKVDLDRILFTRTNYITSDLSSDQKTQVQVDFGQGKYFIIFISPERFQTKKFREQLSLINVDKSFAYAVIDEVHCLSEWGHDFRISYLNLANTIENLSPEAKYIGLTATASVNVLKDIQSEFKIPNENVKTPPDFTRRELRFDVIDDSSQKEKALTNLLQSLENKWNHHASTEEEKKCGIIFTPHVNGNKGCYYLSSRLTTALKLEVRYFAGSVPRVAGNPIMQNQTFDTLKYSAQTDFKDNKYHLLAATKAFGMGVNKGNVAYTIHYGIPGSMEALYQEAGRAGRDKQLFQETPADCYVLLTRDPNVNVLKEIWEPTVTVDKLNELTKKTYHAGDINTNLFMMVNNLDTVNNEYKLMYRLYTQYYPTEGQNLNIVVVASSLGTIKSKVEKAIYRLLQLGIIQDWTVEDFFRGVFEITFHRVTDDLIRQNLENNIAKYDKDFTLREIIANPTDHYRYLVSGKLSGKFNDVQFYFLVLLLWSYEHFAYNRRQSLKNVYDQCSSLAQGDISNAEFKSALEGYFKFNESSNILQHIADKPHEHERWFDPFYVIRNNKRTDEMISLEAINELKDQLSRFLESYMNNVGLDLMSGIIRLHLDDFDDADGRQRFVSAINKIKEYDDNAISSIINKIIEITSMLTNSQKGSIVESVHQVFNNDEIIDKFYRNYSDDVSLGILVNAQSSRLANVSKKLKEFRWQKK